MKYNNSCAYTIDQRLVWLFNTYFKYLNANQCGEVGVEIQGCALYAARHCDKNHSRIARSHVHSDINRSSERTANR